MSPILDWFGGDFEKGDGEILGFEAYGKRGSIVAFVALYLSPEDRQLLQSKKFSVSFLDYDWSLNERKR